MQGGRLFRLRCTLCQRLPGVVNAPAAIFLLLGQDASTLLLAQLILVVVEYCSGTMAASLTRGGGKCRCMSLLCVACEFYVDLQGLGDSYCTVSGFACALDCNHPRCAGLETSWQSSSLPSLPRPTAGATCRDGNKLHV